MAPSPSNMYADILRRDLCAFIHRSFLELNPQTQFHSNWHIELIAAKLEEVRRGICNRLIINVPPRHLKSHAASIAFPAWLLGHAPARQILCVSYAQDLSDKLARDSRSLMTSNFYQALFDTRISAQRSAVSEFETGDGGYRLSSSITGGITGRGADVIVIDDPLKADDAQSESRRQSVNEWYDNTLRSRLNNQQAGAIIIVMQRLHADDLVAHVQEHESWDVLSFPAIAEVDETYAFATPYGIKRFLRTTGEVLQPDLLSLATLGTQRQSMTDYHFVAQYQQNPQPRSGIIVKREWLKFYSPTEKPATFDQIIQSWDTANKDTELANFSVCTTWGIKDKHIFLLDVFRRKLDFPALKRAVRELAGLHRASIVLIEDKASGTSLIQELRAENFSIAQAAPPPEGDKIMRLRAQTAKIEGGFVHFPKEAHWLDTYILELVSFPNSKNDDQVDSTVYALAWTTQNPEPGIIGYMRNEVEAAKPSTKQTTTMIRVWVPAGSSHLILITGRTIAIPEDRIVEVTEEEAVWMIPNGCRRLT
jgi:predicted phage terminase large subunit-like protein